MAAIVREVIIGEQIFIIRRPYVKIDNDNAKVLQLLDLLKNLDRYLDWGNFFLSEIVPNLWTILYQNTLTFTY